MFWDEWKPPMDVYETEDAVFVEIELPEVDRSMVRIVRDGNRLIIEGTKGSPHGLEGVRFLRIERFSGPFRRVVRLPFVPDEKNIKAVMGKGVLKVIINKKTHRVELEGE